MDGLPILQSSQQMNADSESAEYVSRDQSQPSLLRRQIWAIGGGKGGVGKSLISSSIAISLAKLGKQVLAIDLDLGGSNLHTSLGVGVPATSLSDYIEGRKTSLQDCAAPTGIQNLSLISGAQDAVGIANMSRKHRDRLIHEIRNLSADHIICDLGAGTHHQTIDFFLTAHVPIVAVLPEPTSIENAYRFIKSAYFRHLLNDPSLHEIHDKIETALDPHNAAQIKSPSDLYRDISQSRPDLAIKLKACIENLALRIVLNQARTQSDIEIGHSMRTVCKKYFGIEIDYLGHLEYDPCVWQSIRRKRPLVLEFPSSKIAHTFSLLAEHIANAPF